MNALSICSTIPVAGECGEISYQLFKALPEPRPSSAPRATQLPADALAPADRATRRSELACAAAKGRDATAENSALWEAAQANGLAIAVGIDGSARIGLQALEESAAGRVKRVKRVGKRGGESRVAGKHGHHHRTTEH
jgi:hypothetical protein